MSTTKQTTAPHQLVNQLAQANQAAAAIQITGQDSYNSVAATLREIVALKNHPFLLDLRAAKEETYAVWKSAVARLQKYETAIDMAVAAYKSPLIKWDQEQERIRQEEQRRLEAEARAREEEERLRNAVAAQEQGASAEEVEAILDTPEPVVATVAPPTYQRAAGISRPRENWKGECTSLMALVCHIAGVKQLTHPELLMLLEPNQVAINQTARAQKQLCRIPGVRVFNDPNLAVR